MLTKKLSAVHRTLMDTLRTVTIWAVEVFIFYVLHIPEYGECASARRPPVALAQSQCCFSTELLERGSARGLRVAHYRNAPV